MYELLHKLNFIKLMYSYIFITSQYYSLIDLLHSAFLQCNNISFAVYVDLKQ